METRRSLATVLFTDIVGSTEKAAELGDRVWRGLLRKHHALVRQELRRYGGREVSTAGDGFLATFDRPAQAILCACAIRDAVRGLGLEIRGGMHMGEIEWEEKTIGGIAVHIGARVAAKAAPGEVLISSTVRDLEAGSGFGFEDRGSHALKGVPEEWRLYAVSSCPSGFGESARRWWPPRVTQGRGVLAGVVAFLVLFVLAGLYVGLLDRGGEPDRVGTRTSGEAGEVLLGARPPETPPAPGPTAARPIPSTGERVVTPGESAAAGGEVVPPPRVSYESARRATDESRRAALDANAPQLGQDLFQRGDSIRDAALAAAGRGRYADAEGGMKLAARHFARARSAATGRAKLEVARRSVGSLRELADRSASEYAEGEVWEKRAAGAERAEKYDEAAAHLARATEAYRKAALSPQEPQPVVPPPTEEEPAPGGRQPPSADAAQPAPAAPTPTPAETVQRTLGELRRAIESEDLAALRRTWVSLTPSDERNFERWFNLMRDIKVQYDVRSLDSTDDRITVTLRTTYTFYEESSNQEGSETFAQVLELAPRDGRWVVLGNRQ